jgi:hypothetical protein
LNSFEQQSITLFTSEFFLFDEDEDSFHENVNYAIYHQNENEDVKFKDFNSKIIFQESTESSQDDIKYGVVFSKQLLHDDSQLKKSCYIDIETEYDGNCFFQSIAKFIPEKYVNAQQVRNAVVNYCYLEAFEWPQYTLKILADADELTIFLGNCELSFSADQIDSYISTMQQPGAWADEFWLAAVAKMENIALELYTQEGKLIAIYGKENENLNLESVLIYTGDHYYVRIY